MSSLAALLLAVPLVVAPPTSSATSAPTLRKGVYEGPCGVTDVRQYAAWLGREPDVVLDYLDKTRWEYLEYPKWWTDCWSGRSMVFGVPLIPSIDGGSLSAGASGAYNGHFATLAKNLVAGGQAQAILRLGWEFNGSWYPWHASVSPAAFAQYWRQIVDTMRAVPGAAFTFVWNPTIGPEEFPAEQAWPGDSYVDYVGLDVYDMSWAAATYPYPAAATSDDIAARRARAWEGYITGDHGLDFWTSFAASHGKQLAIPEWGLAARPDGHGGGDNPLFVRRMTTWIKANASAGAIYFDARSDLIDSRLTLFPKAAAVYRCLYGR